MRKRRAVLNLTYASIALSILEAEGLAAVCCTAVEAKWRGLSQQPEGGFKITSPFLSLSGDRRSSYPGRATGKMGAWAISSGAGALGPLLTAPWGVFTTSS